jgi:LmbE family N-acetylglucosaminyl deacetylase
MQMIQTNFRISYRDTEAQRKEKKVFSALLRLMLCVSVSLWPFISLHTAQAQAVNADKLELHQALLDLTNPWTVMCVAAHPDDEDGSTLTVLRRKYGAHTVTLFSTFGEGGQNAIGPELYEELGAIRARETLRAAEIQGSEAHFLALKDFGFSKSAEETFRIWGHDEALRRMVLQIRKLRPDVIITNHDTTSGHGHHQATGRLILEAFDAAADPKRFPEQLKETTVWQPQRLFVRFRSASANAGNKSGAGETQRANQLISINPNERDPVRSTSYAEQALSALQQHASQGPWPTNVPQSGASIINYRLVREAQNAAPLPADAQTFVDGLPLSEEVKRRLSMLKIEGRPLFHFLNERDGLISALASASNNAVLSEKPEPKVSAHDSLLGARILIALAILSGVKVTITPQDRTLMPQTPASFTISISNQGKDEVKLRKVAFTSDGKILNDEAQVKAPATLAAQSSVNLKVERELPAGTPTTVPHAAHLYDGLWRGEQFLAFVRVNIDGINGTDFLLLAETWVDVAPAVQIAQLSPSPYVLTPATLNKHLTFKLGLVNYLSTPFKGNLVIDNDEDSIHEVANSISLGPREKRELEFKSSVIPFDGPDGRRNPKSLPHTLKLSISAPASTKRLTEQEVRIVYSDARVRPHLRVGYVRSFDDTLRNALDALGVESRELSMEDVRANDLQKYDTIIIDNRGYEAHPELIAANARLLEFAKNGGTLIVFYHKSNEWNPDQQKLRPQLAPLPIMLGNERVTQEDAPVTFTDAQHPLLNAPNKITQEDFKDWVQERGLYYPKTWDAAYRAPLAMSDTGEPALQGGLLTLDYGRGQYIYTSMVWYRQLRAGHSGAYRVFANMISHRGTETRR